MKTEADDSKKNSMFYIPPESRLDISKRNLKICVVSSYCLFVFGWTGILTVKGETIVEEVLGPAEDQALLAPIMRNSMDPDTPKA